jgi:hypothetical protein
MEENLNTYSAEKNIRIIREGSILQVRFGLNFYARLGLILESILKDKTPDEITRAAEIIRDKKQHEEEWIVHYETMLYLMKAIEEYAEDNKLFDFLSEEEYVEYMKTRMPKEEQES